MKKLYYLSLLLNFSSLFAYHLSTPSSYATEAGANIFKQKGNAIDAIIAASLTLNVSDPHMMGIGGGGIALVWFKNKAYVIEHREESPAHFPAKDFLLQKMQLPYHEFTALSSSVGVPGTVAGIGHLSKTFGRISWDKLFPDAIKHAKDGVTILPKAYVRLQENWIRLHNEAKKIFGEQGRILSPSSKLVQKDLARTLETLKKEKAGSFYYGNFGREWLKSAQTLGVSIDDSDLKEYKVRTPEPVTFNVFGVKGITVPPPSEGGIMVGAALRYLEHHYKKLSIAPNSLHRVITTAETLKEFAKFSKKNIGDLDSFNMPQFYGSAEEQKIWKTLDATLKIKLDALPKDIKASTSRIPQKSTPELGHTAHLIAIDDDSLVSYSTTIEQFYGSGHVPPGFGFLLNNELTDFDSEGPNIAEPKKRPRSSMAPTLFLKNNKPYLTVGCAGGMRIPWAIVELLENIFIFKMSIDEAMSYGRIYLHADNTLEIEPQYAPQSLKLENFGYKVQLLDPVRTIAQACMKNPKGKAWKCVADPRYHGTAF